MSSISARSVPSCCVITGGAGNLACQLSWALADRFKRLVLLDVAPAPIARVPDHVDYETMNICDFSRLENLLKTHRPTAIIHLASLLSGSSEQDHRATWRINTTATLEILEQARLLPDCRVLFASTIATYGGLLPNRLTEDQPQWPSTLYGVTKVACERLGAYARETHGLDFRCLRLPITISRHASAGAVSAAASRAFIESCQKGRFVFQARPETQIAGIYAKDVIKAFVDLLEAPRDHIRQPVYNIGGFAATFAELAETIRRRLPGVELRFELAEEVDRVFSHWPREIDDGNARRDWGWKPDYDLAATATDFIQELRRESGQAS